jgi:AcrR family transcriptional regulator
VSGLDRLQREQAPSWEDLCRALYRQNRNRIRIQKEEVAVRNLQKVLRAALTLSRSKGFHAMTLRDLSRATGLSTGVLYSCFASKRDLHQILLEQGVLFTVRYLRQRIRKAARPGERLRDAIRHHIYLSEIFPSWFTFLYMEARNLSRTEKRKAVRSEMATDRIFHEILMDGIREGEFVIRDGRLTAAAIRALLQDWHLRRSKYKRLRVTPDTYAEYVAQLVQASINGARHEPTETIRHGLPSRD